MSLNVGQIWLSEDTGNRWEILGVNRQRVWVKRLNAPEWDDGLYVFHSSQFRLPLMVLDDQEFIHQSVTTQADYGGAFDGRTVTSDADPCL